jgi:hypothetical protein
LAEGFLHMQRWELDSKHFGPGNPTACTGEAIFGLISLLLRPFAPLRQRLEVATARLEAVPAFLRNASRQTHSAPAAWLQRARRECTGARLLLGRGVDRLLADEQQAAPDFRAAADRALRAFERFDAFLASEVVITRDYACGDEALDRILRHAHGLNHGADELEHMALEHLRRETDALGDRNPDATSESVSGVGRYPALWRQVAELAREHDLVTFPDWPVRFVQTPAWAREAAPYLYFLPYRSPPPMDDLPEVDHFVPPEANEPTIKLNHVVHHASLGHHVQNWHAARAQSRVGRIAAVDCASRIAMLCGGTLAEGWATYAVDLAEEVGFLTEVERLAQHRTRMKMAARAMVDIRLHQGRFGLEDAVEFYIRHAGMSESAAQAEAVKNSLFPGGACMYIAGWDAIWRLRRALQARYSLRTLHDRLLSFGSVPVSLIARAMLRAPTVPALTEL